MLEARLNEAVTLKRLLDSIKELVTDANFECNEEGLKLQAMDNSHVALVAVKLDADGFKRYRCDRPMPLGVNLSSLTKVLKCAKDDDVCILKAADDADILTLTYEARNSDRIAEYEMKLMDIDADQLGIPDTEYDARVAMPSTEFARIVRDLSQLGESVRIEVSKEGVRFVSDGEAANGSVLLKQSDATKPKNEDSDDDDDDDDDDDKPEASDDDDDDADAEKKPKVKKEKKVKKEGQSDDAEDVEMSGDADADDEGEFKPKSDDEGEEEQDEEDGRKKKRKKAPAKNGKPAKKARRSTGDGDGDDDDAQSVRIEMNQHVSLTFSLKYLVNFAKSASLAKSVKLMMSNDVPLLVSYEFNQGHIRYYLAPKIGDD